MTTVGNPVPRLVALEIAEDSITARLADGRKISVPLAWSWRLSDATLEQRNNFEIIGNGVGVHWPDIDEDLSTEGLLRGAPAPRSAHATKGKSKPTRRRTKRSS